MADQDPPPQQDEVAEEQTKSDAAAPEESTTSAETAEESSSSSSSQPSEETTPEHTSVYVGNLSFEQSQTDMEQLFTPFGELTEVTLKRGFAFVHFKNEEDANNAVEKLNGSELGGRQLRVEVSKKKEKYNPRNDRNDRGAEEAKNLFVAGLPIDITDDELVKIFETYGVVDSVRLHSVKSNQPLRSAFVDYQNLEDARTAHTTEITYKGEVLRTDYNIRKNPRNMQNNNNNYRGGGGGGGGYGNSSYSSSGRGYAQQSNYRDDRRSQHDDRRNDYRRDDFRRDDYRRDDYRRDDYRRDDYRRDDYRRDDYRSGRGYAQQSNYRDDRRSQHDDRRNDYRRDDFRGNQQAVPRDDYGRDGGYAKQQDQHAGAQSQQSNQEQPAQQEYRRRSRSRDWICYLVIRNTFFCIQIGRYA